jgi:dipeptidyl aminopeptidase/acylaminoacyl peptidase
MRSERACHSFVTAPVRGAVVLSTLLLTAAGPLAAQSPKGRLTMEAFLHAQWIYQPAWSPDGRYVAYVADDWVRQNIYVAPAAGGAPIRVSDSPNFIGNPSFNSAGEAPTWAPDSRALLYAQDGDLFVTSVPDAKILRLTDTAESETGARFSPDGAQIAFSKGGDLYVLNHTSGTIRQLTRERRGDGGIVWSPDGQWIAFSSGASVAVAWSPDYSGSLVSYHWRKPGPRDVGIVSSSGGPVRWMAASAEYESFADWAPDSRSMLVERRSADVKDRALLVTTIDGTSVQQIYAQHDDKFLPSNDQHARFSPDGRTIAFTSDGDGWNHLYLVRPDGTGLRQLTTGSYEVSFPSWSPDGKRLLFCSTEHGTEQRHAYTVDVDSSRRTRLTTAAGVNTAAALAPDGRQYLFLRSDPTNVPDVWVGSIPPGGEPRRLTDAMPSSLRKYEWQTPQIVTFPSEVDGTQIKAQLFVPRGLEKGRTYPAIIHTHQAAIYQEVYLGPGPQKDNVAWYGFNQRLAQEGYVVLNVDYRGSYGYGRDFRVGDYRDLGGNDARDVISAIAYLRSLGYVDTNRLGVYGMSYGGHMVLSLLTKFPNAFRAGVDIAGVADFLLNYESLYGPWILGRLGTPEQNPEAYRNASAINFIEQLKSPLLILHGTNDPNVTVLQSIMLVDRLLKAGKTFEFEIYPGEIHFFTKRRSWVDAFGKIEKFFDEHVRRAPLGRASRASS